MDPVKTAIDLMLKNPDLPSAFKDGLRASQIVTLPARLDGLLLSIIGHLGAAKIQRVPSDDKILADHIEDALDLAVQARRALNPELET